MSVKLRFMALGALVALGGLLAVLLAAAPVAARSGAAVPNIDNNNRAQVASTFQSAIEENLGLNPQWTGSTNGCNAGTATEEFDAATIESINWFRSMTGLQPVAENRAQSAGAQQAALMMHAQGALSHYPTSAWSCHTTSGAESAGLSNLTLGINGVRSILGQIEDPGAGNEALGHRRWLLYPKLSEVGVANTSFANVVQVINNFDTGSSETEWVAWPPAGFVPESTVFPRWSLGYAGNGSIDFSNARVTVTENGTPRNVRVLPIHEGFGDSTLGWEVVGADPRQAGDVRYDVVVTGMVINGRSSTHRYTVTSFDASAPLGPSCNGHQATIIGTSGNDHLRGTAGPDVIVGLGGHDVIDGLAGNDIICGGLGNDLIRSGWGNDRAFGGSGQDIIRGANGNDMLHGGNGRDTLNGGVGADTLIGGDHIDTLLGSAGTDTCWGRAVSQSIATSDAITCERGR